MNWRGPSLSLYDLSTGTCRRKKVGSCQGLFARKENSALICSGKEGIVSTCAVENGTVNEVAKPGPFIHAGYARDADLLILGLGDPFTITEQSVTHRKISSKIMVLSVGGRKDPITLEPPQPFEDLWVSSEGTRIFLAHGRLVRAYTLEGHRMEVVTEHQLPEPLEAWLVIPEYGLLLGADLRSATGTITAWRM
jgi:hypothetical protein